MFPGKNINIYSCFLGYISPHSTPHFVSPYIKYRNDCQYLSFRKVVKRKNKNGLPQKETNET